MKLNFSIIWVLTVNGQITPLEREWVPGSLNRVLYWKVIRKWITNVYFIVHTDPARRKDGKEEAVLLREQEYSETHAPIFKLHWNRRSDNRQLYLVRLAGEPVAGCGGCPAFPLLLTFPLGRGRATSGPFRVTWSPHLGDMPGTAFLKILITTLRQHYMAYSCIWYVYQIYFTW